MSMLLYSWHSGLASWLASLPSSAMGFGRAEVDTYDRQQKASPNPRVNLLNGIDLYKESIAQT